MDGSLGPQEPMRRQRFRPLWWMAPAALVAALIVPMSVAVHSYTPRYIAVDHIFIGGFTLVLCLLGLLVFILSATVSTMVFGNVGNQQYSIAPRGLDLIGGISVVAYVIWFREIGANPGLIMDVVSGEKMNLRDDIGTIPGVTTLVQFGVCYCVLYSINLSYGEKLPLRHHLCFALLGAFALFRSMMWSERLALIEYFLPFVLFYLSRINDPRKLLRTLLLSAVPYLSLLLSFATFSTGEYFRSWKFYADKNIDFFAFMIDRWLGYYLTSMNNGAALVALFSDDIPDYKFFYVLNWFYQLPGIGPWLHRAMDVNFDPGEYVLLNYLNPEFNVFSGIFPIFYDFGLLAGLLFWAIAGAFFGAMYAGFASRRGLGFILYPTLFISLLEILRQGYFFSTRYVYILVACLIAFAFFRQKRRTAPAAPKILSPHQAMPAPAAAWTGRTRRQSQISSSPS